MSHPAEPALKHLSEMDEFQFDAYSELLGGASWDDFITRWFPLDQRSEKFSPASLMSSRFSAPNQFLLSDKMSRLCPLEVLWLKWNVFSDLCHDIHAFHRDKKKPHLNIKPQRVRIHIPHRLSESLPARWIFSLDLDKRKASRRFSLKEMPKDLLKYLFIPPKGDEDSYQAPVIREKSLGLEVSGMVAVRSIEKIQNSETVLEKEKQDIEGITEFHFVSDEIQQTLFSENDVFLAKLYFYDDPSESLDIWASHPVLLEKGILLKGSIAAMDAEHWEKFEQSKDSIFSHATLKIYKAYHTPCDLYSLGMMLLHLLLVNEEQDIKEVNSGVQRLVLRLPPMVQGLGSEDRLILLQRFQAVFDEYNPIFFKSAIFYSCKSQEPVRPFIHDDLWTEVLIFAFRLITFIPGFSYCKNHGDVNREKPHLLMEKILPLVAVFSERIKQDLFGSHQRDAEIQEVCNLLRAELITGETR